MSDKVWFMNVRGRPIFVDKDSAKELEFQKKGKIYPGVPKEKYYPQYDQSVDNADIEVLPDHETGENLLKTEKV